MITITLPDGSMREVESGTTPVAMSISEGLARNVLAAVVDGAVVDATRPINNNATLKLLTWNDDDGKSTMWHSSAHLMAEALEAHYPGIKLAIGPPVENGFYYDVDFGDNEFSQSDFPKIEKTMLELARKKSEYIRRAKRVNTSARRFLKLMLLLISNKKMTPTNSSLLMGLRMEILLFTLKGISPICVVDHTFLIQVSLRPQSS